MLSEVVDDDDEVQEVNFQNSSGIRTSARLQARAWQEIKTHESAPKSARISLHDEEVQLIATSSDEESASDEEREDFPSLEPRPELYFNLFDAYVGDYGAFATHKSEQLLPMIHIQKVIQRLPQPIVRWQQADFAQKKILAGSKARFRLQCWRR